MINPILGIDTWEGQLEIDEAVLKANNVAFIFVRLNDMNGGHHKDAGFDKQWKEAQNFYRAPYFVYNPWVSGSANFFWLQANMPADAKAVAFDIEVSIPSSSGTLGGYSPVTYAAEVKKFIELCRPKWNFVIYTGEWFLSYLTSWETKADYWWAQYPSEFYPANDLSLTWDELRAKLVKYNAPGNVTKIPGRLRFWQFSGDRLILPGNAREMDLNVFFGTMAELAAFFGIPSLPPPPLPEPTDIITTPHNGMTRISGMRYGWKFELFKLDPTKFTFKVVCSDILTNISTYAKTFNPILTINAGEWNDRDPQAANYLHPKDYTMSNGKTCIDKDRFAARPSLLVFNDGFVAIDYVKHPTDYQALTGVIYLIRNGKIEPTLYDTTKVDNTEGHARTIFGINAQGFLIGFVSQGVYPNQGLTHLQAAELLMQNGAVTAFFASGGGDTSANLDGQSLIVPENINPATGSHFERALPSALLIYAKGEIPMSDTAISTTHDLSLRTKHQVIDSSTIVSILKNTSVPVFDTWTAPDTTPLNNKGDFWVYVHYKTFEGWVGLIHLGIKYGEYTPGTVTPPTPPATPPTSMFITHTFADELAITQPDGPVRFYNANFTVPNVEYKPKP
jgi:GH25 family lysozyme M1 (1,4-beta-N-acetylmuramidase)/exopolysaccharide biosynthesis protein